MAGGNLKRRIVVGSYIVDYSEPNQTWQVWKGDKLITDFHLRKYAVSYAQKNTLLGTHDLIPKQGETLFTKEEVLRFASFLQENFYKEGRALRYTSLKPKKYKDCSLETAFQYWQQAK